MEKLFYTIGEVARMLGESVSLVRFWANTFPKYVKPQRNTKGNRRFTASDVEALKQIHHLVREQGLTLDGAAKALASRRTGVKTTVKALDCLKEIRAQLRDIKNSL